MTTHGKIRNHGVSAINENAGSFKMMEHTDEQSEYQAMSRCKKSMMSQCLHQWRVLVVAQKVTG